MATSSIRWGVSSPATTATTSSRLSSTTPTSRGILTSKRRRRCEPSRSRGRRPTCFGSARSSRGARSARGRGQKGIVARHCRRGRPTRGVLYERDRRDDLHRRCLAGRVSRQCLHRRRAGVISSIVRRSSRSPTISLLSRAARDAGAGVRRFEGHLVPAGPVRQRPRRQSVHPRYVPGGDRASRQLAADHQDSISTSPAGATRGGLYRVIRAIAAAEQQRERSSIDGPSRAMRSTAELVAMSTHPNGWHRTTAARLLYEQNDPEAMTAAGHIVQS